MNILIYPVLSNSYETARKAFLKHLSILKKSQALINPSFNGPHELLQ
jgi:hypothetical protein